MWYSLKWFWFCQQHNYAQPKTLSFLHIQVHFSLNLYHVFACSLYSLLLMNLIIDTSLINFKFKCIMKTWRVLTLETVLALSFFIKDVTIFPVFFDSITSRFCTFFELPANLNSFYFSFWYFLFEVKLNILKHYLKRSCVFEHVQFYPDSYL